MERTASSSSASDGASVHDPEMDTSGTVFGLDVRSDIPLAFLRGSSATPTGRRLEVSVERGDAARLEWAHDAELVCDERDPDDAQIFRIESHPQSGHLISGPQYGSYLLAADGRSLRCKPEGLPDAAWQRLLIAQVLPFAALLRGLEVFHAGAVVRDRRAIAFLGPSGVGKTSIALECCRRGASFLTDDVLALEPLGHELLAHPGTPLAGIDDAQAARMRTETGRVVEQIPSVNPSERLVRMAGANESVPLGTLFFIDRRVGGPEQPRFAPAADAQLLLASTFNFVLATPTRLRGLLEVCALAARLRVERVLIGPGTSVRELGAAIERRLDSAT